MSDTIIQVEDLGKLYRLGEIGTGTISHDLNRWWARVRGKEDPFSKIGETNDRTARGSSDYVWALKDINFEVRQGEVLGIIGRNGAGKSTLLKILSKVTTPSQGRIKVRGRIASLLEVGTGFHPELTGRENIFLNGAILGMTKAEIRKKFDEIVDFAGVERYIDTPVKRYSSGMYVRLAFAVAAFLEPEILIVDEVLAVGDAEFQEKCMGRMQYVSEHDGRTVLFVSHNIAAINKLCKTGLLLKNGTTQVQGNINNVVESYLSLEKSNPSFYVAQKVESPLYIGKVELANSNHSNNFNNTFSHDETIAVNIQVCNDSLLDRITIGVALLNSAKEKLFTSHFDVPKIQNKSVRLSCIIPKDLLNQGKYSLDVAIFQKGGVVFEYLTDICKFDIIDIGSDMFYQAGDNIGSIRVACEWEVYA